MTTAYPLSTIAADPIPVAPPDPVARARPAFIDASATLHVCRSSVDPHVVITANEACTECDGEGHHEVEIPRGVWTSWQGGMWVPDSRMIECERCHETGVIDARSRCVRCGLLHPDVDAWGVAWNEPSCECDPEDVLATLKEIDRVDTLLYRAAVLALDARAAGVTMLPTVHDIEWGVWCALVARHRASYRRYHDRVLTWYAATIPFGFDAMPVNVFTTAPKGV